MQNFVTQLLGLEALVKEVHWNATGRGFIAVHEYLDEVYDSCEHYVDEIAEHMVAQGAYGHPRFSVGDFETFPQLYVQNNPTSVSTGVQAIVKYLVDLTDNLDESLANDSDDPAGEDILIRALQEFNKHLWFLSNELE